MNIARPSNQAVINAPARVLTLPATSLPNAAAPPMPASNAIRLPIRPHTMMIQPIVSSPMTDNITPVKLVSRSDGARISNPTREPAMRGSMVRLEITASTNTTRVGTRHIIPVSAISLLKQSVPDQYSGSEYH